MTARILISACLLGQPVRYDGRGLAIEDPILARWRAAGLLVPICPELAGGLPVPRAPVEITGGAGDEVLDGGARVLSRSEDCTAAFLRGAEAALALARRMGCGHAVLTERSPSCGAARIHDGSFSGRLRPGAGVTTALLRRHGVQVFSQHQLAELERLLLKSATTMTTMDERPDDETP